jgi:hypothetical protein
MSSSEQTERVAFRRMHFELRALLLEPPDVSVAMPDAIVAMLVSRREDGEVRVRAGDDRRAWMRGNRERRREGVGWGARSAGRRSSKAPHFRLGRRLRAVTHAGRSDFGDGVSFMAA